jgi:hypothetical protein
VTLDQVGASPIDHPKGVLTVKTTDAACKAVALWGHQGASPCSPTDEDFAAVVQRRDSAFRARSVQVQLLSAVRHQDARRVRAQMPP